MLRSIYVWLLKGGNGFYFMWGSLNFHLADVQSRAQAFQWTADGPYGKALFLAFYLVGARL